MSDHAPPPLLEGALALDHVAIAVPDLESALPFWRDQLGATVLGTEEVPSQKVRVAFLSTGMAKTELLEPTSPESPIAKFLNQGRRGLHHVAYRVENIEEILTKLKRAGSRMIQESSVPGSRGTKVAFLHPSTAGGVLVELVEYTTQTDDRKGTR